MIWGMGRGSEVTVVTVEQESPLLGRQVVHDPRSWDYQHPARRVDAQPPALRHRVFGPRETPRQRYGCCTLVDKCVQMDTRGNRRMGVVFGMADAERWYPETTRNDPFAGEFDLATGEVDTGSSPLAACKTVIRAGEADRYEWIMTGAAGVLAALVGGNGRRGGPVGVGTWWLEGMFHPDPDSLIIRPTGRRVGGHQYTVIGWAPRWQAFDVLCWWGEQYGQRGMVRLPYRDLDALLDDQGDAHRIYRANPTG